jgi:hypothetical protein
MPHTLPGLVNAHPPKRRALLREKETPRIKRMRGNMPSSDGNLERASAIHERNGETT